MSGRKRKKRSSRNTRKRGGFAQRLLVGLSGVILTLCAASITYGFFIRLSNGEQRQYRVAVLNGTGVAGLAHEARRGLLEMGIDVIEVGNAESYDYPESVLIARRADVDVAELGRILGCGRVVEQVRSGTLEDATLILGADYKDLHLNWD